MNILANIRRNRIMPSLGVIALLFLWTSSAGIPLNRHWCMNQIVSQAVFAAPISCHPVQESASETQVSTSPCCLTETLLLQNPEDNWSTNPQKSSVDQIPALYVQEHIFVAQGFIAPKPNYLHPSSIGPPPDLTKLYQSFLN